MFGRKLKFGKQKMTFDQLKQTMRPMQDEDGVTRVFPKELWNDPQIGPMLRQLGFNPDDARNIYRTADDYRALFLASKQRLDARIDQFNSEMTSRFGYCRVAPFLVVDGPVYDGEHGAFLYAQMDLLPYDDWNVILLAADERTQALCDLPAHPGSVPTITAVALKRVIEWRQQHEKVLALWGVTATGGKGGISAEEYEQKKADLRQHMIAHVAWMKTGILKELRRVRGMPLPA